MFEQVTPLDAYPAFSADTFKQLAGILESRFAAKFVKLPDHDAAVDARANLLNLSQSELWYCAYGVPLTMEFPEGDYVRLQVQHKGAGATWIGTDMVPVTATQACIASTAVEVHFGADFEQIVWRIPKGKLEQKLATLTGRPIGYALNFDTALDLATPQAGMIKQLIGCMLNTVGATGAQSSKIILCELEQAFITSFLAVSNHSGRHLLEGPSPSAASWQVRRAESYIEANWDKAITIEDLAAVSGTSTRSLFRSFKESRGYSPLEFARRLRLQHARKMLDTSEAAMTVTNVAFTCGFGDLSRFSKDFTRAFGEAPSTVLARSKGLVRVA